MSNLTSIDYKKLRWLGEQTINGPQLGRKGLAECHAAIPALLDEIEDLKSKLQVFSNIHENPELVED